MIKGNAVFMLRLIKILILGISLIILVLSATGFKEFSLEIPKWFFLEAKK